MQTLDALTQYQLILMSFSFLFGVCFIIAEMIFLGNIILPRNIRVGKKNDNDDELAIVQSIDLIKEAKKELEIFDDGDFSESYKSLYNDNRFIEVVKDKLKSNHSFKMRVFFNDGDERLQFIQEFKGHKRVKIYKRLPGKEEPLDIHYRLIDGGTKGILSRHDRGDGNREYKELNISPVPRLDKFMAGRIVLRRYRKPKNQFKKLEVS